MSANSSSGQDERALLQQLVGQYGGPAFVRRARSTEAAWEQLLDQCRKARHERLAMVRLQLGTLAALAGAWERLRPHVENEAALLVLQSLHNELQPRLRVPVERTESAGKLRRALGELREGIAYFNSRWREYLAQVNLSGVNALRDAYNRFYLLEKECALGSAHIARRGFTRLEHATLDDLLREFPPLTPP
jgi:hypothetical protein